MPKVNLGLLRELFRAHVLKMLKKEGLRDDGFIRMIMKWRHTSGFNVHNEVRIKPDDEKGIENLSQYIIRNTFSLEKVKYEEGSSSVIYRSKLTHGKNKRNFEVFSSLEFIASITQHMPEPYFQLTRVYGWYSNRMRGDRKKQEGREERINNGEAAQDNKIIDIRNYKPKRIPQLMWRECIKKIWEVVDPLTCPKCTGEMKIISFIYKRTVIRKVLTHLNLYEEQGNQRAPAIPKKGIILSELRWSPAMTAGLVLRRRYWRLKKNQNHKGICATKTGWNRGAKASLHAEPDGDTLKSPIYLKDRLKDDSFWVFVELMEVMC